MRFMWIICALAYLALAALSAEGDKDAMRDFLILSLLSTVLAKLDDKKEPQ